MRALRARINRRLCAGNEMLKAARGQRTQQEFGLWYTVDFRINGVTGKHVDPEQSGRELGVLHEWERVAE
jgi:hypothetical protein